MPFKMVIYAHFFKKYRIWEAACRIRSWIKSLFKGMLLRLCV